jgi:hypothetical protein
VRKSARTIVLLALSGLVGVVAFLLVPEPLPELSRGEFMDEVRAGHVHRIEIKDQQVILSESTTRGPFRADFNKVRDAGLPDELRALGVEIWYTRSPPGI